MEAIGLLVTLEARAGKEADAEAFLKSAEPLALNEKGTLKWYAIKPWAGHVSPGSASALVVRILIHANGLVYVTGLMMGGGWRSLLPRRTDLFDALRMFRYYVGFPFAKLARRQARAEEVRHLRYLCK